MTDTNYLRYFLGRVPFHEYDFTCKRASCGLLLVYPLITHNPIMKGKMQERAIRSLRAATAGIVALVLSYSLLKPAGFLCAVLIRRHWPEASFAGLIVWYGYFFALGVSVVIAIFVGRKLWRQAAQSK